MQGSDEMAFRMNDLTQFIIMPKIRYDQDIGTYVSYDIAAYDCFKSSIVEIVWDVTSDRELALNICEKFNRHQLSTVHLKDAILDMIG